MKFPVRFVLLPSALMTLILIASPAIMPAGEAPSAAPAKANETTKAEKETDEATPSTPARPDPVAIDYWRAIKLLGSKVPADVEAGRIALKSASDLEYTHAQVLLGNCHLSGSYGFPKSAKKAANLFRLAAERGNAFAKVSLALCYYSGDGVGKDETAAVNWLTAAIAPDADFNRPAPPADFFSTDTKAGANADDGLSGNLGDDPAAQSQATAHHLLGQILQRQKKDAEAQIHFVAAATAGANGHSGIYEAAQQAALNFAFGKGVPRDLAKANEMLDRARQLTARMGVNMVHNYASLKIVDEFAVADIEETITNTGAEIQTALQHQIAELFADKKSKDYNPAEAVKWYELAADSGQVWAMLSLAFIYSEGDLGQPDPAKAFHWFEKAGDGEKPKHYLAVANLGICLQNGLGTASDAARAMALFQKQKNNDIVCYLGTIGQCPPKIVTFEQELKLNQDWAKGKNDPHAQYLLAIRYKNGWGVKDDQKEALKLLKKAAGKNDPEALCDLGLLYETAPSLLGVKTYPEAYKTATDYYRAASERGNIEATANYGNMLASGRGVARDTDKAEEMYLKCLATDPKHSRAHNNLSLIYQNRLISALSHKDSTMPANLVLTPNATEADKWRKKMLQHLEESAQQNYPYALSTLGDLYYQGKLVPRDLRKAMGYYEQLTAAPTHQKNAHFQLGLMHEHGEGVPITFTEAAYHYRLAALDGHIEALTRLINFYISGQGVSRDVDRAAFWLQYMARLGQPKALTMLCDIMLTKKEFTQAVELLKQLVEHYEFNPEIAGYAHERLSLCYEKGYGVKPSASRAAKHFKLAVERGNSNALVTLAKQQTASGKFDEALASYQRAAEDSSVASYMLGQIYYFGTHTEKNLPLAFKYSYRSARRSNPDALYFLAYLTSNNVPGAPSLDEAIQFTKQAENIGHAQAAELRARLESLRKNTTAPEDTAKARSS